MEPLPEQTQDSAIQFDFSAYPLDTLFLDRRTLPSGPATEPPRTQEALGSSPPRRERRRRIDPTTFEKQYTPDELEFMNALQRFKLQSGKMFPSHGDILRVAVALGYRKAIPIDEPAEPSTIHADLCLTVGCAANQ